jgi:hypothetical protein
MLDSMLCMPAPELEELRPRSAENLKSSSENPFFSVDSRGPPLPPPKPSSSAEVPVNLFFVARALSRSG